MKKKTASFCEGFKLGLVNYVIFNKTVYFTQTEGIYTSINAAEEIVTSISNAEILNFKNFRWVDIQRKPLENAEDELILSDDVSPKVVRWTPITVPQEVFQALLR